jgi:hypothetical protein
MHSPYEFSCKLPSSYICTGCGHVRGLERAWYWLYFPPPKMLPRPWTKNRDIHSQPCDAHSQIGTLSWNSRMVQGDRGAITWRADDDAHR